MDPSQKTARLPFSWEANLAAAGLLLWVLGVSVALTFLLPLAVVLVVAQSLVIVPILGWVLLRGLPLRETFRLRPVGFRTVILSALIGMAGWPIISAAATLLDKPLNRIGPYPATPAPSGWVEAAAYAVTFLLIAPLTEEPIYRGFILRGWLRRGAWTGIVVSGFLFGLVHSQIAATVPIAALGIILAWMSYRSGSIWNTVVAHGFYNLAPTVFYVFPALQQNLSDLGIYIAAVIAIPLLGLLLWLYHRAHPRAPIEDPTPETGSELWPILTLIPAIGLFGFMALIELLLRAFPGGFGGM
jgi:membrane protease YdiL (CAAX protease family)